MITFKKSVMRIFQLIRSKTVCLLLLLLLVNGAANSQRMISSADPTDRNIVFCNPADYNFTITQGSNLTGCYYDISFNLNWSVGGMSLCSPMQFPHGFYVSVSGATITSTGPLSSWFTGSTLTTSGNSRYWNKAPLGTCTSLVNEIMPNTLQSVRIYVSTSAACTPVRVSATILYGNSWTVPAWTPVNITAMQSLPYKAYWDCGMDTTFTCANVYHIGDNFTICTGTDTTLHLLGNVPGVLPQWVKWYTAPCSTNPPTTHPPAAPWTLVQSTGLDFNTNAITSCSYYMAVINNGCNTFYSNLLKIDVCPGKPVATPTITTGPGSNPLNTQNHACNSWSGQFSVAVSPSASCTPTKSWWKRVDGGPWSSIGGDVFTTVPQNFSILSDQCTTRYDIQARLGNVCDTTRVDFTIYIDKPAVGGHINTLSTDPWDIGTGPNNTSPILCYNTGTRLTHATICGEIKRWEYRDELSPCSNTFSSWVPAAGSDGTSVWWTNRLIKTRQYRALVVNGACTGLNARYSDTITVKVKPKLTVNISSPSSIICTSSLLTANTSYGAPCNYPIASYQWYLNGAAISGAVSATYTATAAGNYTVVAFDGNCGKGTSDPVKLCKPALAISGPCCICDNTAIPDVNSICATVTENCGIVPTGWKWFKNGVTIPSATTSCISVQSSGTYTVEVHVGSCVLTQTIVIAPCRQ